MSRSRKFNYFACAAFFTVGIYLMYKGVSASLGLWIFYLGVIFSWIGAPKVPRKSKPFWTGSRTEWICVACLTVVVIGFGIHAFTYQPRGSDISDVTSRREEFPAWQAFPIWILMMGVLVFQFMREKKKLQRSDSIQDPVTQSTIALDDRIFVLGYLLIFLGSFPLWMGWSALSELWRIVNLGPGEIKATPFLPLWTAHYGFLGVLVIWTGILIVRKSVVKAVWSPRLSALGVGLMLPGIFLLLAGWPALSELWEIARLNYEELKDSPYQPFGSSYYGLFGLILVWTGLWCVGESILMRMGLITGDTDEAQMTGG